MLTTMQLRMLERLRKEAIEADNALHTFEKRLALDCDHPRAYVQPYEWEHDNGYGQQSTHVGKRCTICERLDLWNRGVWNDR